MLRDNKLTYENLFVEIPVVIKNSSMTNVLLCELDTVQDNTSFFTLPTRLVEYLILLDIEIEIEKLSNF